MEEPATGGPPPTSTTPNPPERKLNRRQRRLLEKLARKEAKQQARRSGEASSSSGSPFRYERPAETAAADAGPEPLSEASPPDPVHDPESEGVLFRKLLTYLPFERDCFGGEIPKGRLFVLLCRELARASLAACCTSEDDRVADAAIDRTALYEDRLNRRLAEQRRAFPEERAEPLSRYEEGAALAQMHGWLLEARKSHSAEGFLMRLMADLDFLPSLQASEAPDGHADWTARALVTGLWRLARVHPADERGKLSRASALLRVALRRRDWELARETTWEDTRKAISRVVVRQIDLARLPPDDERIRLAMEGRARLVGEPAAKEAHAPLS